MYAKINGSISLLILTKEGIYAARDKNGVTPLIIGENNGDIAVASETCSFPNLGFSLKKFLEPGEIIFISKKGIESKKKGNRLNKICAFLWIYTGFPASSYENINVEMVRENCGKFLASRDDMEIDLVSGVPDSGTAHAIGYAIGCGKPFRRVLLKYTPGYGRSYTPLSQDMRDRIALMKLIANEEITKDMVIKENIKTENVDVKSKDNNIDYLTGNAIAENKIASRTIVYESTAEKAKNLIPIFLIILSVLLNIILILKR